MTEKQYPYVLTGASLDMLKLLAIALMITDHVNEVVFKESVRWMYYLGRGAFPLFAFSMACHLLRKPKLENYLHRLVLFALLSQPVYMLAFQQNSLNILFTLVLGAIVGVWLLRQSEWWRHALCVLSISSFFFKDPMDFDIAGVLLPGMLACAFAGYRFAWAWTLVLVFLLNMSLGDFAGIEEEELAVSLELSMHQVLSMLATYIVPLTVYLVCRMISGKRFLVWYLLYLVYPGHLLALTLYRMWEHSISYKIFSW